jgi:protein-L-isoaspartate(D-aspartate) O-methyltransferase
MNQDLRDDYYFKQARKEMVELLKRKGITDENVLIAMENVERHRFTLNTYEETLLYKDAARVTGFDQTISHPSTVAFQTQLLEVQAGMKILEIGTGSGYQAAVLKAMHARVWTIERNNKLIERAALLFKQQKIDVFYKFGDGFAGWKQFAPYDRILVTCGAPYLPPRLLEQLKTGGIMVIPIGEDIQEMKKITKLSEMELKEENFGTFRFVPMLEKVVVM